MRKKVEASALKVQYSADALKRARYRDTNPSLDSWNDDKRKKASLDIRKILKETDLEREWDSKHAQIKAWELNKEVFSSLVWEPWIFLDSLAPGAQLIRGLLV